MDLPIALQKKTLQAHPVVAAGFQADKEGDFRAELAQTRFKGGEPFRAGEHFYRLEQHVAASIDRRSTVKAFSNVDTNEDARTCHRPAGSPRLFIQSTAHDVFDFVVERMFSSCFFIRPCGVEGQKE